MSWLDPVRAALDGLPVPSPVFFRDDDAGWADDRLGALLDRFERHAVPVDVAVIPAELSPELVRTLRARAQAGAVRLHQHGYAHVNHEPVGRGCEFGPARDLAAQTSDIENGRQLLTNELGDGAVDPVFTPPWNRCTAVTGRALAAVGIPVLSRDLSAGRLQEPGVVEVPISVDWFGKRKGLPLGRTRIAAQIAAAIATQQAVGVMLHHAVTDDAELDAVEDLVALLAAHPAAEPTTIAAVASLAA